MNEFDVEAMLRYLSDEDATALMEGRGGCGIAGICMTDASKADEEWSPTEMAQLLFPALRHRGPHAFGWMTWDGAGDIQHATHPGDVGKVSNLELVKVDEAAKWMVLHVRWATHGDTENQHNNHPLWHGDIIGVHNGVLRNDEEILAETGREFEDTEVDSEAIFAAVDKWGHRAGLRKINGDMATVYSRFSKPQWLYFAKSYGRPLVFARTPAGSLVFASERKILRDVFGHDLTDVRELRDRQLVRVADAKVAESCQFAPDPPKVVERPRSRPRSGARFGDHGFGSSHQRGIDSYLDRQKSTREVIESPPVRLTKKQRQRARRAEAARREASGANWRDREAARLRSESPEGLHYYNGMLVTGDELELLQEYEEQLMNLQTGDDV